MSGDLCALTLEDAASRVRARSVSPVELVRACLARIENVEPKLGAFITLTADAALASARDAEREVRMRGQRAALHGIPLALKDLFETAGVRTTAGSKILADHVPAADAPVVARLREAGAVLLGKLNLHEWALGVTNDNPHFGPVRNPWALDRIPGGSSGGSAAALAAGECFGSLGSDTGGSIRIPASLCGIVGLKPTRGRVSLRGVVPLSWTLDHAGPMARTVRDAAILLQAIAGHDGADPASVPVPVDDYLATIEGGVRGLRLALATRFFLKEAEPAVARAVRDAARLLESQGARVEEVALPRIDEMPAAQRAIVLTDAAAYHADHLRERPDDIGADVLDRLRQGERTSSTEYARARRAGAELRRAMEDFFGEHDALLAPTTPIWALPREGQDAVAAAVRLISLTGPFNLTGLPAISLPCGLSPDGLPIGLQIVAGPWREALVLRVARAYERATTWHERVPVRVA